jgi:molybdate transport system substrate-binding protein
MFKSKRYRLSLFLSLLLVLSVFLAPLSASAATELTVFAAASMTESLNQIAEAYKKSAPDVKLLFNFDSSGTLKTQIENGAQCDIFISAGQKQMNQMDIKADPTVNTQKLNLVAQGTRFNVVSNKVVMIVPKGHNPRGINDFKDAVTEKVSIIALGNSDVPVGQYSEEIFRNLGLWNKLRIMNKISYASTVKEVLSQVAAGAVDCGVVYSTDAATSGKVDVVADAPKGSHKPIAYPAAIMKSTKNMKAATEFLNFLKGPESIKIFSSIGFAIPGK